MVDKKHEDVEKKEKEEEKLDENTDNPNNPHKYVSNPTSFSTKPKNPTKKKQLIIAAVVVALLLVSYLVFGRGGGEESKEEKEEVTTEQPTATPTEEPEIVKEDLSVQVLNGSGTEGGAGDFAEILEGLGYAEADTDNADNYDYEDVTIQVKDTDEGEAIYDALREDLENEDYIVNDIETLDEDSEYDVVVIIGIQEGEEELTVEEDETTEDSEEEDTTEEEATPTPEEPTATPTEAETTPTEEPTITPTE